MLRDPEDYPDPENFNPDRFIKDGRIDPDVRDPGTIAFGFGRRYDSLFMHLNPSSIWTIAFALENG